MTDSQAPTPGPLSGEQKAVEAMQGAIAWDKERGYRMPYRVRDPLYAAIGALTSLAPTAPVEASGSEREDTFKGDDAALVASITALLDLPDSALSHRVPGLAKQLLASAASRLSLRPQPSGETRETVARVIHRNEFEGQAWEDATEAYRQHVLKTASDILALIRPAPVASGGQHSSGEGERADKLASALTDLMPAVRAYLMTGDVMSQGITRNAWEPVLKRAKAALNGAAKPDTAASSGLIETIRTRLIGIAPDDQDVTLEDSDWLLILGALEGRK